MEKYQNKEIKKEISQKWFCVYDYISFKELFLTVQKDYLAILNFINIPFWIISILLFIVNIPLAIGFLLISYLIINILLFIKLIYRSYYFLLVSDVVFTNKWIILWNKAYSNEKEAQDSIKKYEKMFLETLGQESKLQETIDKKLKKLKDNTLSSWSKMFYNLSRFAWRNRNWGQIVILMSVAMVVYTIFLYAFYYIWYFLGIIFFYLFSYILKLIIYFKRNIELEIKKDTTSLDNSLKKLEILYKSISSEISNFKSWEIWNLSKFIQKSFTSFYTTIDISLKQKQSLIKILKSYKYSDFIDFETLNSYIKNNFNKPVLDMVSLLDKIKIDLENQIKEIDLTISNSSHNWVWILEQKKLQLSHSLDLVIVNKKKFEESIL